MPIDDADRACDVRRSHRPASATWPDAATDRPTQPARTTARPARGADRVPRPPRRPVLRIAALLPGGAARAAPSCARGRHHGRQLERARVVRHRQPAARVGRQAMLYGDDASRSSEVAAGFLRAGSTPATCVAGGSPPNVRRACSSSGSCRCCASATRRLATTPCNCSASSPSSAPSCAALAGAQACVTTSTGPESTACGYTSERCRRRHAPVAGSTIDIVVPMELVGVRVEVPANTPVVMLREHGAAPPAADLHRRRPEAQLDPHALEGIEPPRPLTHDLMVQMLERARSRAVDAGRRHRDARPHVLRRAASRRRPGAKVLSSRPSDAIALAVRLDAPIFASRGPARQAGQEPEPEAEDEEEEILDEFRDFLDDLNPDDFARLTDRRAVAAPALDRLVAVDAPT